MAWILFFSFFLSFYKFHVLTFSFFILHSAPVNVLKAFDAGVLISGDDDGNVKIWDVRDARKPAAQISFSEHTDFISDLWCMQNLYNILSVGGDGHLSVYDMRGRGKLLARSDQLEDELLSIAVIKDGKKVVCGSQDGVLDMFTYGDFGDVSDRFPGHPMSIESMVVVDQDTVCTASSDGMIRIVQIHPNKLLGVLGEHGDFPIEVIRMNASKTFMASASHDDLIKFWDVRFLYDDDGEGEEEDGDEQGGDMDGDDSDSDAPSGNSGRQQQAGFFDGL